MKKTASLILATIGTAVAGLQSAHSDESTIIPPTPSGSPHACGSEWYPPAALAAGEEGSTTLAFRVGTDGSPKQISIATSSGYADLDSAAKNCVATWKYQPATRADQAIEVDWKSTVQWSMAAANKTVTVVVTRGTNPAPTHPAPTQQPIGSRVCKNPMAPPAPLGKITTVTFRILPDGSIENVRLVRSSGDTKLDALALDCVTSWRFTALPDGARKGLSIEFARVPW